MSTGEFREITDFIVTTTDVVLQIGQINSYLAFNTDTKIVAQSMSSLNSSLRPLSDIAYYYQGVVVRLTSGNAIGQESVVCDYTIDPITGLPNLTLLSPFSAIPQVGDTFQLVSTRNYYAVIASPFSVALPSIPIYSEALSTTEYTAGYEVETILSLNENLKESDAAGRLIQSTGVQLLRYTIEGKDDLPPESLGLFIVSWRYFYYYNSEDNGATWTFFNSHTVSNTAEILLSSFILFHYGGSQTKVRAGGMVATRYTVGMPDEKIQFNYQTGSIFGNYDAVELAKGGFPFILKESYDTGTGLWMMVLFYTDASYRIRVTKRQSSTYLSDLSLWTSVYDYDTGVDGVVGDVILADISGGTEKWYIVYQRVSDTALGTLANECYIIESTDGTASVWGAATLVQDEIAINYVFAQPRIVKRLGDYLQMGYYEFDATNLYTQNPYDTNLYTLVTNETTPIYQLSNNLISQPNVNAWFPLQLYESPQSNGTTDLYFYYVGNFLSELNLIKESEIGTPGNIDTITHQSNLIYFSVLESAFDGDEFPFNPLVAVGHDVNTLSLVSPLGTFENSIGVQYRIRGEQPFKSGTSASGQLSAGPSPTFQFTLGSEFSSVDDFYAGRYIWVYSAITSTGEVPGDIHVFNDFRYITAYDGATRTGTVLNPFSGSLSLLSTNPVNFEILNVASTYNPLSYAQSRVLVQQSTCYELYLSSLTLPNIFLENALGNRIAFYNYVYVELRPLSSGVSSNLFISNNPNSRGMLFHVPITNVSSPEIAAFVQLRGVMTETIKFNPLDGFHFAVYLSNGELFKGPDDSVPPQEPDFYLQVSAVFQFRRV